MAGYLFRFRYYCHYTVRMKHHLYITCSIAFVVLLVIVSVFAIRSRLIHKQIYTGTLVSLGDSVAAGDGLPESSGSLAASCHQSVQAYPYLVASDLNLKLDQFACSGALTTTGILQPQTVGQQIITAQLAAATPYIRNSDVVITIGANDIDWSSFLITCARTNCQTAANRTLLQMRLANLQTNLDSLLGKLALLHPHEVLLNTYYSIINNSDTCLQQFGVSQNSITWVNSSEANLNNTIVSAAKIYHDRYTTITFAGHGLCSSDPWVQGLSATAPLHPTYEGQYNISTIDEAMLR